MTKNEEKDVVTDKLQKLADNTETKKICLIQLKKHPLNNYPHENIETLAQDIRRNGLLHNLVVSEKPGAVFAVLSGERRRLALNKLDEDYGNASKWDKAVLCRCYKNLTERQEQIIIDSANLQARGSSGADEQVMREATNRYIDNLKAEFGIMESTAKALTKEICGGSDRTVERNRQIETNMSPELVKHLDNGYITKADAATLTNLSVEEQEKLADTLDDMEDEDEKRKTVQDSVSIAKAEKKANAKTKKKKNDDDNSGEDFIGEVETSRLPEDERLIIAYLDKFKNIRDMLSSLKDPSTLAQIKRLDKKLEDEGKDTILTAFNSLLADMHGFKQAIADAPEFAHQDTDASYEMEID